MKKLSAYIEKVTTPKVQQKEIAEKMGVHPSLVSHWMAGRRKPGRDKLKQLSALTGIKIEDLI
jgi:transcriptional regulator with XRE-family HTH domain